MQRIACWCGTANAEAEVSGNVKPAALLLTPAFYSDLSKLGRMQETSTQNLDRPLHGQCQSKHMRVADHRGLLAKLALEGAFSSQQRMNER